MAPTITLIGAGRMGAALAAGWLKAMPAPSVTIVDPTPTSQVESWAEAGRIKLNPPVTEADILVLAVKPQIFPQISDQIRSYIGSQTRVLSVMAGVSLDTLQQRLGADQIARAMPNTPGMIGQGVTILTVKQDTDPADITILRGLLEPLGAVEGPLEEALLPAATAVSGCGPAYGYLLVELMAQAGVKHGLDPDFAMRLARKTVEGAGALMAASPDAASTLRKNVTSPNGVIQAALEVLMAPEAGPALFEQAVAAAIARDHALSQETS